MRSAERLWNRLDRALMALSCALVLGAMGLVLVEVASRYIAGRSESWSEELVRFAIVWSVLIAGGGTLVRGGHIGMDMLVRRLPRKLGLWISRAVNLAGVIVFAILTVVTGQWIQQTKAMSVRSSSTLELPMFLVYIPVAVGFAIMALAFATQALRPAGQSEEG